MQSPAGVLLVLGFLAGGVLTLSCEPCTCSGKSEWSEMANLQVAKCSNVKHLTSVPYTLPENIQGLNIEYCPGITTLQQNAFASLKNLEVIYVRLGELRSIQSHAFRGMTNVKIISLDYNKLTDLATDVFSDTPNLYKLYLYVNKLQILRRHLFANLPHLEYIDLSNNNLILVESYTFVNVPILETLFLDGNLLTNLSLDFIDNTCSLKNLYLQKNPWQCNVFLCGVMEMVTRREMWRSNSTIPKCAAPLCWKGKQWDDLEPMLVMCHPTEQCWSSAVNCQK